SILDKTIINSKSLEDAGIYQGRRRKGSTFEMEIIYNAIVQTLVCYLHSICWDSVEHSFPLCLVDCYRICLACST
ncbi:hypothetical protein Csa_023931, partial [Cucumis sativus]